MMTPAAAPEFSFNPQASFHRNHPMTRSGIWEDPAVFGNCEDFDSPLTLAVYQAKNIPIIGHPLILVVAEEHEDSVVAEYFTFLLDEHDTLYSRRFFGTRQCASASPILEMNHHLLARHALWQAERQLGQHIAELFRHTPNPELLNYTLELFSANLDQLFHLYVCGSGGYSEKLQLIEQHTRSSHLRNFLAVLREFCSAQVECAAIAS